MEEGGGGQVSTRWGRGDTTTKAIIFKDHPVHHHRGCLTGRCPKDFALEERDQIYLVSTIAIH